MPAYEIAADSADIRLDEARAGAFRGRVVNRTTNAMRTSLRLEVRGNAQWSWLTLVPSGDRDLVPGEPLAFSVAVAVPGVVAGGRYACTLRAVDVRSPDERCSDELVLSFTVAGVPERAARAWPPVWALILLAGGLLGVLAVVAMLVGRSIAPGVVLLVTAAAVAAIGVWERQRVAAHRRGAASPRPAPPAETAVSAAHGGATTPAVASTTPPAAEPAAPSGGGGAAPPVVRASDTEPSDPPTMRGGA